MCCAGGVNNEDNQTMFPLSSISLSCISSFDSSCRVLMTKKKQVLTIVTFKLFLKYIYYILLVRETHKVIPILEMKVRVVGPRLKKMKNHIARGFFHGLIFMIILHPTLTKVGCGTITICMHHES